MTNPARWGALLVASLLPGCRPPEAPASPPATAPAAGAPAPGPSPAPPLPRTGKPLTASDPVALLPGDDVLPAPQAAPGSRLLRTTTVRYGRGQLELRRHIASHCPLKGLAPGCLDYGFSGPRPAPDPLAWFSGEAPAQPDGPVLARRVAPRDWTAITGGHDGLYALASPDGAIDRIDEQGNVTAFVADKRVERWRFFWVFEHGQRVWFLGLGDGLELTEAVAVADGELPRALSPSVELPWTHLMQGSSAQAARRAARPGLAVMAGEPRFRPLGPDRWAMAWIEVIPPERGAPRGPGGAKNGCGSRFGPSRPLGDPSVEKRAHLAVFRGTTLEQDQVLWSRPTLDPGDATLSLSFRGETPALEARSPRDPWRAVSLDSSQMTAEQAPLHSDESPAVAAFDPTSGEGAVALWIHHTIHWRTFDRAGAFVGEARSYSHPLPPERWSARSLRRVGGRWYALLSNAVLPLSDDAPPQDQSNDPIVPVALADIDGKLTLLQRGSRSIEAVTLDAKGKRASGPRPIAPAPAAWSDHNNLWLANRGGKLTLLGLQTLTYQPSHQRALGSLEPAPKASWLWPLTLDDNRTQLSFIPTHDDLIALLEGATTQAIWLRSGKAVSAAVSSGHPLLVPPDEPGPIAIHAELDGIGARCAQQIHTGGPSTLLVCTAGTGPDTLGTRVSLRRLGAAPR